MYSPIDRLFDEAENRYLKPEELKGLAHYVQSVPLRVETYRYVRDHELDIMQWVADQLEAEFPQEATATIEQCLKNGLLLLRYSSLSLLLNDDRILKERFLTWVSQQAQIDETQAIDNQLYHLLTQKLSETLTPTQLKLLNPLLTLAQSTFAPTPTPAPVNGTAALW